MEILIDRKRVALVLIACISVLLIANCIGIFVRFTVPPEEITFETGYNFLLKFDLDAEVNIPTFYSAVVLLFCSIFLLIIAHEQKARGRNYRSWTVLSLIFLFLAFDEAAALHEILIKTFRGIFHTGGVLYWAWVIPYGALLVVFVLAFTKFLFRLPKRTRYWFIASGFIYVLGAIGFEMLGSAQADSLGGNIHPQYSFGLLYVATYTMEELLEMVGAAMFLSTLVSHISREYGSVVLRLGSEQNVPVAPLTVRERSGEKE